MSKHLILYGHCVPVRGKSQGAIYDLQRGNILFVPNSMIDLLEVMRDYSYGKSRKMVDSDIYFKEYTNFILTNDLGFFTHTPERFVSLPNQFFSPEHISNAVIEYDFSHTALAKLFEELNLLLCKHVELRIVVDDFSINNLSSVIKYSNGTTIRSIELHLLYNDTVAKADLLEFAAANNKIRGITVHNAPEYYINGKYSVFYIPDMWDEVENRHFPQDVFIVNPSFFMESQLYNPYYHKKICIDKQGHIKNSLLNSNEYGIFGPSNSLTDVLKSDTFKNLWFVKPDLIEGVRESETRYATLYTQDIEVRNERYYLI